MHYLQSPVILQTWRHTNAPLRWTTQNNWLKRMKNIHLKYNSCNDPSNIFYLACISFLARWLTVVCILKVETFPCFMKIVIDLSRTTITWCHGCLLIGSTSKTDELCVFVDDTEDDFLEAGDDDANYVRRSSTVCYDCTCVGAGHPVLHGSIVSCCSLWRRSSITSDGLWEQRKVSQVHVRGEEFAQTLGVLEVVRNFFRVIMFYLLTYLLLTFVKDIWCYDPNVLINLWTTLGQAS